MCKFSIFFHRYPVAIKIPKNRTERDFAEFLEEVKSMIEIKAYHENIVNLQGITYENEMIRNLAWRYTK